MHRHRPVVASLLYLRTRGAVYRGAIELAGRGVLVPLVAVLAVVGLIAVCASGSASALAGSPGTPAATSTEPPPSAKQALEANESADAGIVEGLVDTWVVQLASAPTSEAPAYLPVHDSLNQRYGTVLLRSDGFVFRRPGYWVDVIPTSYPTADGALSWCSTHELPDTDCYAKYLTKDPRVDITTAHIK